MLLDKSFILLYKLAFFDACIILQSLVKNQTHITIFGNKKVDLVWKPNNVHDKLKNLLKKCIYINK